MKIKVTELFKKISDIIRLEKVDIYLNTNTAEGKKIYADFTKPHSRFLVIKNKTVGVALINSLDFKTSEEYIQSVNGKNSAAYFSRKAVRSGYSFREINPNDFVDSIYEINNSKKIRQGIEMGDAYKVKISDYPISPAYKYFGVFKESKLVAYNWICYSGELAIITRLLGHADYLNEGIMYLLITKTVGELIDKEKNIKFIMYDTLFGATEGLKLFKNRLGFRPYKVKWKKTDVKERV